MGRAEQRNKDSAHAQWMKAHNVQRTSTVDPLSYRTVRLPYSPVVNSTPGTARAHRREGNIRANGGREPQVPAPTFRPPSLAETTLYRTADNGFLPAVIDSTFRKPVDYTEYGLRQISPTRFVVDHTIPAPDEGTRLEVQ